MKLYLSSAASTGFSRPQRTGIRRSQSFSPSANPGTIYADMQRKLLRARLQHMNKNLRKQQVLRDSCCDDWSFAVFFYLASQQLICFANDAKLFPVSQGASHLLVFQYIYIIYLYIIYVLDLCKHALQQRIENSTFAAKEQKTIDDYTSEVDKLRKCVDCQPLLLTRTLL